MKLFDKIKDLFMDEITDDDEIDLEEEENNQYKEPPKDVLPKVMRDTIEREEEKKIDFKIDLGEGKKDNLKVEEVKTEPAKKFSFPIDFEDDLPRRNSNNSNVNVLNVQKKETPKKVTELYPKKEEVKEKPKFKATPVISPVYGILDKNYKKDEVKEKAEDKIDMKRPSKKVDFETVRKKAFGNLADDIKDNLMCENCELYKEVKKISAMSPDDLLYDMTIDEEEEVTINKAYENYEEFGVAYEAKTSSAKEDVEEIETDKIEEDTEKIQDIVLDKVDEKVVDIQEEEIEVPSREDKKKETKVDKDFFDLIDSMYKERTDD